MGTPPPFASGAAGVDFTRPGKSWSAFPGLLPEADRGNGRQAVRPYSYSHRQVRSYPRRSILVYGIPPVGMIFIPGGDMFLLATVGRDRNRNQSI